MDGRKEGREAEREGERVAIERVSLRFMIDHFRDASFVGFRTRPSFEMQEGENTMHRKERRDLIG